MSDNICGHCVSYDMWCGICLNPCSKSFEYNLEYIFNNAACELFTQEECFKSENIDESCN